MFVTRLNQRVSVVERGKHGALRVSVPIELPAADDVIESRVDMRVTWAAVVDGAGVV